MASPQATEVVQKLADGQNRPDLTGTDYSFAYVYQGTVSHVVSLRGQRRSLSCNLVPVRPTVWRSNLETLERLRICSRCDRGWEGPRN